MAEAESNSPAWPQRELFRASVVVVGASVLVVALLTFPALRFTLPGWLNLLTHMLVETVSIVVAAMVFAVGWHTAGRGASGAVALACNTFLAVAILDFVHMLTFEGMPPMLHPSGGGNAIGFFLAARLLAGLALLMLVVMPVQRPVRPAAQWAVLAVTLAVALGVSVVGLADPGVRRLFLVPGVGLTPLKIGIEYLIIALNLAAAAGFLWRARRGAAGPLPMVDLAAAAALAALSELCLTLYSSTQDQFNVVGHVYKVMAYLLLYRALYVSLVRQPYVQLEAARQELADSEEKFRMLFESSLDGVLLTRLDGVLLTRLDGTVYAANAAACRMFRTTPQVLREMGPQGLLDAGGERLRELVSELVRTGSARGDLVLRRNDGSTFDAEVASAMRRDSAGQPLVSTVVRDISESKRARQQVDEINASLEQRVRERTEQLQALNEELKAFSSSAAHDLRSPLVAIAGYTKVLENALGERLAPRERHYFSRIQAGVMRMEEMITVLLKLAQVTRSSMNLQPLDLSVMAQQVVAACRERDPERQVQVHIQPGLQAWGDRALMLLVLENLIGNAWKFTAQRADARIELGAEEGADGPVYFVRDNGAGFDMASYDKLFGVFQRLHTPQEFPGHGIGLANVRRIVARHHGRVWAESAPGQGAVFRFTLGLALPESAAG